MKTPPQKMIKEKEIISEKLELKFTDPKSQKLSTGGSVNAEPAIYVADLTAYNNGILQGKWLKLDDYSDAEELMEEIQNLLKKWSKGDDELHEEYAIHDYEYLPTTLAGEYMGMSEFEKYYEVKEQADNANLPLDVVFEWMSQTGMDDADRVEDAYIGQYDSAEKMAEEYFDEGILTPSSSDYYVSDTDRRLIANEQGDFYVDDIRESEPERLIEEAELDIEEFEEADEDRREEMLDEAREVVHERIYDEWYDGLEDPYYFLVEEQGLYDDESFKTLSFVQVDFESLGKELEWDHTFVEGEDGDTYVFTNNYKKGGTIQSRAKDRKYMSSEPHEIRYARMKKLNRSGYKGKLKTYPLYLKPSRVEKMSTGGTALDEIAMREIQLYIENDSQLYSSRIVPMQKNLITKLAQGKYSKELAPKLFLYLVEAGDKKYRKEFYSPNDQNGFILSKPERLALAKELADDFYNEAKAGDFNYLLPKKYAETEIKFD